jgi:hypothetical protein
MVSTPNIKNRTGGQSTRMLSVVIGDIRFRIEHADTIEAAQDKEK